MKEEKVQELCARLGVPDSERLTRIWQLLCDDEEAELLLALPGTAGELASRLGRSPQQVKQMAQRLFRKGVVFPANKPEGTVYRAPKHFIQFHDASVQWPEAPASFHGAWREFMVEEYPSLLARLMDAGFSSFMRIVPTPEAARGLPQLSPLEDVAAMIEEAKDLAVCDCPCRTTEKNCAAPVQNCIQFNKGALYSLERGNGKAIDKKKALRLIQEAAAAGLVQMVENRPGLGTVLCNCCTCCCAILKPYLRTEGCQPVLRPSRFAVCVEEEGCIGDGLCVEVCPTNALELNDANAAILADPAACLGCGLCVMECPSEVLSLEAMRDEDFLPSPSP